MRIAILVWGSLRWDPRNLETTGEWFEDGPMLPIEFARISGGDRLTLVIKPTFDNVRTLYTISSHNTLADARANLAAREDPSANVNNIGFIDFTTQTHHVRQPNNFILATLTNWNQTKNFDAILWSDFAPRFTDRLNLPFTLANVINYLTNLPENEKRGALQYIRKAPEQITTRFRASIEKRFEGQLLVNKNN